MLTNAYLVKRITERLKTAGKLFLIASLLTTALIPYSAFSRDFFFVGNATSNVTLDLTSFTATGTNNWSGTVSIGMPLLWCDVFVYNPGPNSQTITSASIKTATEIPTYAGAFTWGTNNSNPWRHNAAWAGSAIDAVNNAPASMWVNKGTFGDGNTIEEQGMWWMPPIFPLTITANQFVTFRTSMFVSWIPLTYTNGWLNTTAATSTRLPNMKTHHNCVGKISVTDTDSTQSGVVYATGSMQYIADSYQQWPSPQGGIITHGYNYVDMFHTVANAQARFTTALQYNTAGFDASDQAFYWVPLSPFGIAYYMFGRAEGRFSARNDGYMYYILDNNWTRSTSNSIKIQSLPISINGGQPL